MWPRPTSEGVDTPSRAVGRSPIAWIIIALAMACTAAVAHEWSVPWYVVAGTIAAAGLAAFVALTAVATVLG